MDNRFLSRAYIKKLGWLMPVKRINYDCQTLEVDLSCGNGDFAEYEFDEVVLEQCTGLEDKNGKLIFEGDIFKDLRGRICTVEWDAEDARFLGVRQVGNDRLIAYVGQEPSVEVIGNIHDTPGELGGEKGVIWA